MMTKKDFEKLFWYTQTQLSRLATENLLMLIFLIFMFAVIFIGALLTFIQAYPNFCQVSQ